MSCDLYRWFRSWTLSIIPTCSPALNGVTISPLHIFLLPSVSIGLGWGIYLALFSCSSFLTCYENYFHLTSWLYILLIKIASIKHVILSRSNMLMHLMSSSWSLLWTCLELFHLNGWRSLHLPKFSPLSQAKHKTMAVFFPPCLSACIVPALPDYIQLVCKNKSLHIGEMAGQRAPHGAFYRLRRKLCFRTVIACSVKK